MEEVSINKVGSYNKMFHLSQGMLFFCSYWYNASTFTGRLIVAVSKASCL